MQTLNLQGLELKTDCVSEAHTLLLLTEGAAVTPELLVQAGSRIATTFIFQLTKD